MIIYEVPDVSFHQIYELRTIACAKENFHNAHTSTSSVELPDVQVFTSAKASVDKCDARDDDSSTAVG